MTKKQDNKKTLGLIGYGSFGKLVVDVFGQDYSFEVHTRTKPKTLPKNTKFVSITRVSSKPIIILAVPLGVYKNTLKHISKYAPKNAIVIDVCSVKAVPFKLAQKYLRDDIEFVGTHPLFGPQSAAKSLNDQTLVLCNPNETEFINKFNKLMHKKGLNVIKMSPQEHDRQMAEVHALTFFVARGLMNTGLHKNTLQTPSFKKMLDLAELETHHSQALFETIEGGNPYARAVRIKFIKQLKSLNKNIRKIS